MVERFLALNGVDDEKLKGALKAIYLAGYMEGCNDAKMIIRTDKSTPHASAGPVILGDLSHRIDGLVVAKKPEFDKALKQLRENGL